MDYERSEIDIERTVAPVFPLPNTVLFPATSLSLHVFEPRYRTMVEDVAADDGLIVVSLATQDGFSDLGTIGRIQDLEPLEDGAFKLRLLGLGRSMLTEIAADTPYRKVRVEARPERPGTHDPDRIAAARLELLASYGILRSMVQGNAPLVSLQNLPFEEMVNTACARLPVEASLRQRLLQQDTLIDRQRLGVEFLSTAIEAVRWLRVLKASDHALKN